MSDIISLSSDSESSPVESSMPSSSSTSATRQSTQSRHLLRISSKLKQLQQKRPDLSTHTQQPKSTTESTTTTSTSKQFKSSSSLITKQQFRPFISTNQQKQSISDILSNADDKTNRLFDRSLIRE